MALLFDDERAAKAVLPFLIRKTKVGQMVTLPPRDVQLEDEDEERVEGKQEGEAGEVDGEDWGPGSR